MYKVVQVIDTRGNKLLQEYPIELHSLGNQPEAPDFIVEARRSAAEDKLVAADELKFLRYVVKS